MVYYEYDVIKGNYFDGILNDVCFMLLWIVIFFISYDIFNNVFYVWLN